MSVGEGVLEQAFEAMGWPIPKVKRVATLLLLVSMLVFPVTFEACLDGVRRAGDSEHPPPAPASVAPTYARAVAACEVIHKQGIPTLVVALPETPPQITPEVARALVAILCTGEQEHAFAQEPLDVEGDV